MARTAKKQKELTPEEKLALALVPIEDQPYPIPENWCWTKLGYLISTSKERETSFFDPTLRYVGLEHMEKDKGIISFGTCEGIKSQKTVFHEGQLLYGKLRPYLNKHDVASFAGVCSTDILVFNSNAAVDIRFVNYYLDLDTFIEYSVANSKGINLPRVNEQTVLDATFPLPPLAEQQRIVDRIETLFSKLDEAKEKAQSFIDSYEDRESAILHQAFSGELTKEWRNKNGIDFSVTWAVGQLGEYADNQYGYTEKASSEKLGPHYLRITDIQDGSVKWEEVPYCVIDELIKKKYSLKKGDIVVARTGATTGKSYMIIDDVDSVFASYLIRICIIRKECLSTKYLYYYLQSPDYWEQITEMSSGIAQPGVNGNKLKTLCLPIPNLEEQNEIVRVLDSLLPRERRAKEVAEHMLERVDKTKKSILAQAFHGQLGTADSNDETTETNLRRMHFDC